MPNRNWNPKFPNFEKWGPRSASLTSKLICNDSTECWCESSLQWPLALFFSPWWLSTNHLSYCSTRLEAKKMNTPVISFWKWFDTQLMTVANSMTSRLLALLKELHLKHPWGYGFLLIAAIEWMMSLWQDRKAFSINSASC